MALSGDVKALIQAANGDVLAGTNNSARIYKSSDNGSTWTQVVALGSGLDSVNAFVRVRSSNYILAAVSGSTTASGIWRSTNNGSTWTKVKVHPSGTGYLDITAIQGGSSIVAVGKATSFPNSPVIYSTDQGSNWQDVSISYYNQDQIAVAAYPDPVLATAYNSAYAGVFAFYGSNTFYTTIGGVGYGGTSFGFSTVGGGAGNGGLDMASFLQGVSPGTYYIHALWAVKSALNTANTEIWSWPASPTENNFSFAKIATITGENFQGLYVDPTPDYTHTARTIWAGGNGKIYVSYNNGFTWAVSSTLISIGGPVGQVYSFVRTSSGVLIAGAANGEIFQFFGTGSEGGGTGGGDTTTPPPTTDTGVLTSKVLGREETCEDEVYVSNKFSFSNVTHVFHYNGSTYTNFQFSGEPPYELLGATAAVGKIAYFGSKSNDVNVPGGPFSSLIFDVIQESKNITVVWEYWNGSAWTTLTTQDNTDQFKRPGVHEVTWQIPSNWAAVAVNSVTGYWVRARTTAVSAGSQVPIQGNRYIYTSLLPCIEIAEEQVSGDLPAMGRIKWTSRVGIDVERSIVALRSLDRGLNFNPYINISDVQTPFGLTITKATTAGVSWQNDTKAPTGRSLLLSYSSSGDLNSWKNLVTIQLNNTVAREYQGDYRAFIRCYYNNALAQAWNLRLVVLFGSGGTSWVSKSVYPTTLANWEAIDLGSVSIAASHISNQTGSLADQMSLVIQGYNTSTLKPLTLYDLVLIPVDEWAVDAKVPETVTSGTPQIVNNSYLDLDSISNPKVAISAFNRNSAGLIVSRYQAINNGPVILQKNADQRLWFFNMSYENYWRAYPEILGSVQVFKQQQYLTHRGRN